MFSLIPCPLLFGLAALGPANVANISKDEYCCPLPFQEKIQPYALAKNEDFVIQRQISIFSIFRKTKNKFPTASRLLKTEPKSFADSQTK